MADGMTRGDRDDLMKHCRRIEKVAKSAAKQRVAELMATFAAELSAQRKINDARWKDVTAEADAAVAEADARIAAICREIGVTEAFRPSLHLGWASRGENADKSRRLELKYVATTRCAAMLKTAEAEIERRIVEFQTQLLAGGLETVEARAFLEAMPTVSQLMPALSLPEIEAAVPVRELGEGSSWREDSRIEGLSKEAAKLLAEMTK